MTVQLYNPDNPDPNWSVARRVVDQFAPHGQTQPNMTIQLDAGFLLNGTTLTETNPQAVGPFATTPSFRADRVVVSRTTGIASIIAGTDGSFTPPNIPPGTLPIARVNLLSNAAAISNDMIVDERALADLTMSGSGAIAPQGRLTLASGTPVMTSDVVGATTIYYTPYRGNSVPIYNGTSFVGTSFSELSLALSSSHAANTLYDLFVFLNAGVPTLGTGPAWTNSTAGTSARGTGAGTTQLQMLNGFNTNAMVITARNGSNTYTVPANQATYLGSFSTNANAGQTDIQFAPAAAAGGTNNHMFLWNAYNRVTANSTEIDNTSSWTYSSLTWVPYNNSNNNRITYVIGLPEAFCFATLTATCMSSSSGLFVAIGLSLNTSSGIPISVEPQTQITQIATLVCNYMFSSPAGLNYVQGMQQANGTNTGTFYGNHQSNAFYLQLEM